MADLVAYRPEDRAVPAVQEAFPPEEKVALAPYRVASLLAASAGLDFPREAYHREDTADLGAGREDREEGPVRVLPVALADCLAG